MPRPPLPILRSGEELVYDAIERIRRLVRHERLDFVRRRRQSDDGEVGASQKRDAVHLRIWLNPLLFQAPQDEAVYWRAHPSWVSNRRNTRTPRRAERPMLSRRSQCGWLLGFSRPSSAVYPFPDQPRLFIGELFVAHRHGLFDDSPIQQAVLRRAFLERRS